MFAEGEVKTTWKKVKILTSGEFVMRSLGFSVVINRVAQPH